MRELLEWAERIGQALWLLTLLAMLVAVLWLVLS